MVTGFWYSAPLLEALARALLTINKKALTFNHTFKGATALSLVMGGVSKFGAVNEDMTDSQKALRIAR